MEQIKQFLTSKLGMALVAGLVAVVGYYNAEIVKVIQQVVALLTGAPVAQ